jgi:nitrite reductase/ring-hydroxylating ferredoxin subunit
MTQPEHIGAMSEFDVGTITSMEINGEDCVVVCDRKGRFSAFKDLCPHLDLPINNGTITDERLVCPWHGASFHPNTGVVLSLPAASDLQAVPIEVQDGQIVAYPG